VYRYFKNLVELPNRAEDKPGPKMVREPGQLTDLTDKEKKDLRDKIFGDNDPGSDSAVYEYLFEVYFHVPL
jgi:hypothetical protein